MLEVAHVTRRFGENVAVDDVSFAVPPGALTGFVGGNGAGKTTTMRMIMGVLAVQSGEIRWAGRPVTELDRRSFGYMPEERGLYPKQPVFDQLVYLARLRGLPADEAKARTETLLERFDLGSRGKDKLESLSLGNQQRVQIAAAVIAQPTALILDEPFSGLDPVAVDSMVELLREYADQGVPVLFSSHQLDLVEQLCDQLVVLASGRVVGQGSVDELRSSGGSRYRLVLEGDAGWLQGLSGDSRGRECRAACVVRDRRRRHRRGVEGGAVAGVGAGVHRGQADGRRNLPGGDSVNGVWRIVAAREIAVKLRDRNFVISTVVTLVVILASLVLTGFLSSRPDKIDVAITGSDTSVVLDAANTLASNAGTDVSFIARPVADQAAVEQLVREDEVDVGLVPADPSGWQLIGKTAEDDNATTYITAAAQQIALQRNAAVAGVSLTSWPAVRP